MKHRRGINLRPDDYSRNVFDRPATFETVPDWYVLGAVCSRCGRSGGVDRQALERRFGSRKPLQEIRLKLRCRNCGNVGTNEWVMTKAAR